MRLSILTPQRWLLIILAIYIALGIAYSIAIPLAETPDESEHFRYMQVIARSGKLPVMLPEREANLTLEAHQPPLYYLMGTALTGHLDLNPQDNPPDNPCFSFEPDDPGRKNAYLHNSDEWPPQQDLYLAFLLVRWFSVLLGVATIVLAYVIGSQAAPTIAWIGPAVAAMVAFNPQFVFITSSMNNDVPTTVWGAAIVALSVSAISRPRRSIYLLLGIVTGLGVLTKFALIAFWPLALLAAVWPTIRISRSPFAVRLNFDGLFIRLLLVILLPLLIAGWWYVRNYLLYGDPLMWGVTLAAKGSVIARTSPFTIADLAEFASLHFQSYWLWFGWLNIKAPAWIYGLLLLVCLLAAAGLIRLLLKRNVPVYLPALAINGLAILAIYASLLQYIQTINWTGYQGRLAFAAAASIALFITLGLVALGGKRLAFGIAGGLLVLTVAALFFLLLPAYPRPAIYQPGQELKRTCIRFEDGLQVEAVDSSTRVVPGEFLPVTIFGYGLAGSSQPQMMSVHLRGADGQEVGQGTTALAGRAGEFVAATVNIPVAGDALPARAVLDVAMVDENGLDQSATSATGRILEVPADLETIKIAPLEKLSPVPEFIDAVDFDGKLALIGHDVEKDDEKLVITLYWQAQRKMLEDYTTFVHVLGEAGQLLAQDDSQPTRGVYPTSIWDVGEIVADRKVIILPEGIGDERSSVVSGVYLLETQERLPLQKVGGQPQAGDQWLLEPFTP